MFFWMSVLTSLAGMQGVVSLTPLQHIKISRHDILVSDVVQAESVDKAVFQRVANKVIASLPENKSSIELSRTAIANLVRRRVPLFADITAGSDVGNILIENIAYSKLTTHQISNESACKIAVRSISNGEIIFADDLLPAQCLNKAKKQSLAYNRQTGVLRATSNLAVGTYLGALEVPQNKFSDTGEKMLLQIVIGAIRVERPVWTVQPTNGAKHVFVTDVDGELMRVPVRQPIRKARVNDVK